MNSRKDRSLISRAFFHRANFAVGVILIISALRISPAYASFLTVVIGEAVYLCAALMCFGIARVLRHPVGFVCPECKKKLHIPNEFVNTFVQCSFCLTSFIPSMAGVSTRKDAIVSGWSAAVGYVPNSESMERRFGPLFNSEKTQLAVLHIAGLAILALIVFGWNQGHANLIRTYAKNCAVTRAKGLSPCVSCGRPAESITYRGSLSHEEIIRRFCRTCAPKTLSSDRGMFTVDFTICMGASVLAILLPVICGLILGNKSTLPLLRPLLRGPTDPVGIVVWSYIWAVGLALLGSVYCGSLIKTP